MLHTFWITFLYTPLNNMLAFILHIVPYGDVGIAIILLTILVKIALFPLSRRSIISQLKLKKLEPEINKMKMDFPDKTEQAKKTFEIYKREGVNPFSGCLLIGLQLPIIIALFTVFRSGIHFSPEAMYSFVKIPTIVSMKFLGLIDLNTKNIFLAVIVGISQYIIARITASAPIVPKTDGQSSFQEEFAKSMQMQMKYVLPIFIAFFAYIGMGIVALYFVTSNIMTIFQELYIRKRI